MTNQNCTKQNKVAAFYTIQFVVADDYHVALEWIISEERLSSWQTFCI